MTLSPRVLAIDYGTKRVGIAVSDPLGLTAQPLPFIPNNDNLMDTLLELITEKEVGTILVGLPKQLNGQDSQFTGTVREFTELLKQHTSCDVLFQDERLSSQAVNRTLIDADVSRKKRKQVVDSMAAAFVLQGYLDSKPS